MVRKEMLMVSLMAGGYPIDGKPKEKAEKMHPEIWKRYAIFFAVIAIALAVVIGYFAFAGQTPAKTSQDASPEVKTPVENAVVNAAIGTVTIPEGTYKVSTFNDPIPINEFPKSFLIASRGGMLYTNVKLSSTEISGTYTMIKSAKEIMEAGGAGGFELYFYKNGERISNLVVYPKYNYEAGTGTFTVKRPPESFGADAVGILQP